MIKAYSLLVLASLFAISGCAGAGADGPGRGEGSIPIGRAHSTDAREVNVTLRSSGSEYTLNLSANGVVYAPAASLGEDWLVSVTQDGAWTESFTVAPGASPSDVFDVVLLPSNKHADVTGVGWDVVGALNLRVGDSYKLKPVITGTNVSSLQPSYWTSGGLGSVNPGGVFKAKNVGTGTITVSVLGFTAVLTVNVT